jgi:PHP family Zn ribbon phosphoesterase
MDLNSIGQLRLDAKEVGEIQAEISIEEQIEAPGRELAKYRHLLNRKRHHLIRSVMVDKINQIDEILQSLRKALPRSRQTTVKSPDWEKLREQVQEIDSLLGGAITRPSRWNDLQRHLHFGMGQDLLDIIRLDWPDVKPGLQKVLYDEDEPIPVEVTDLAALASAQPKGEVITKLKWKSLTDEDFERLIFSIISSTPGYENPEWLIHTKAADRGRDLSVYRVVHDSLSGTIRSRVLIQCRHWLTRSVSTSDVTQLKDQITTWEPPKIDVLIITTTGRFTSDAVSVIEKHNAGDRALKIEMWPESHLEGLLAKRPALIAEFRLR